MLNYDLERVRDRRYRGASSTVEEKRKEHSRGLPEDLGPESGQNQRRQLGRKMTRERSRTMKIEVERKYSIITTMYITQLRAHSRH